MTTMVSESLSTVREKIRTGQLDEARQDLAAREETEENRAEIQFLRGFLSEMAHDREAALEAYQQVLEQDPQHTEAAFHAALICDQYGDDETAIDLYERCTTDKPAPIHALINLALLYEDQGQLDRAANALQDVIESYPDNHRARQFLKSVESSYSMVFDERLFKDRDRQSAILDLPISEFELSVRSRNCLRQMNIRTVGDLLRTTENDLLVSKNFGETSLNEIKLVLEQKGMRLGQALQEPAEPEEQPLVDVIPETSLHAGRPVADLELSVRSRKALQRLGINTIGELTQRTEAELMSVKNFGQTSLIEIKRQLEKFGLSLREAKK